MPRTPAPGQLPLFPEPPAPDVIPAVLDLPRPSAASMRLLCGNARDVLETLEPASVHACICSPPYYGLRKYSDSAHEIGAEQSPQEYVAALVDVFRGVWRILRPDGLLWLVLGDSYAAGGLGAAPSRKSTLQRHGANGRSPYLDALGAGATRHPPSGMRAKSLLGMPWRVAFALQEDGWIVRSDIIYAKTNPMPESVRDRPTRSHEYIFMLAKQPQYYYDQAAIAEATVGTNHHDVTGGRYAPAGQVPHTGSRNGQTPASRNKRSVWTIASASFSAKKLGMDVEHYAAYPPELIRPMIRAGTSAYGCCPVCLAPYRRVVERTPMVIARSDRREKMGPQGRTQSSGTQVSPASSVTTGWEATCSCPAGAPVSSRVLDPFCGSGTTGLVALQEGRSFVGIDLNASYLDLSRVRIGQACPAPSASSGAAAR